MTRTECLEKIRDMYLWIADKCLETNTPVYKNEYFKEGGPMFEQPVPMNHCYACQYASEKGLDCERCLIDWDGSTRNGMIGCTKLNSSYKKYYEATESDDPSAYKEAAKYARKIADLASEALKKEG